MDLAFTRIHDAEKAFRVDDLAGQIHFCKFLRVIQKFGRTACFGDRRRINLNHVSFVAVNQPAAQTDVLCIVPGEDRIRREFSRTNQEIWLSLLLLLNKRIVGQQRRKRL